MKGFPWSDTLRSLAPTTTWHYAAIIGAAAVVAVLYVRSLAWVRRRVSDGTESSAKGFAAMILAGISWPGSLLLVRALHPTARPPGRPREWRRLVLAVGAVALSAIAAGAVVAPQVAFGVVFLPILALLAAAAMALTTSMLVPALLISQIDSIAGVAVWAVVVAGMLAVVVRNERRQGALSGGHTSA